MYNLGLHWKSSGIGIPEEAPDSVRDYGNPRRLLGRGGSQSTRRYREST